MSYVRLVDIKELQGVPRHVAESGREQYGQVLNTWQALMNKPELFAAYLPFLRQVAGPGVLDGLLKDAVAMYVGVLNHCRYTVSHRSTSAKKNGGSDEFLRKVTAGEWDEFEERTRVALTAARDLTVLPPQVPYGQLHQGMLPETVEAVTRVFDDVERVELLFGIAVWNALARFHRVMDLELDMPPGPVGIDPR
jgi:alkylhydroperoxidase family enzyme